MQTSVETRWFLPGTAPPDVVQWFWDEMMVTQPTRIDSYLYTPKVHSLGIKLREGRIEIKQLNKKLGPYTFHADITGMVGNWNKWGFPISNSHIDVEAESNVWIPVVKERMLRRYQVVSGGKIRAVPGWLFPMQRSSIEITNIVINGTAWWSFGLEVVGTDIDLFEALQTTAVLAFKGRGVPQFSATQSYSYPHWLNLVHPTQPKE